MSDPSQALAVRAQPRLFDRFPSLKDRVPWTPLLPSPTPVARCTSLEPYLGRGDVWMKRDDLASPHYGGNKVRRYEYLFADARARGARTLVTIGGLASTQVTATAVLGREAGFAVRVILFDQPVTGYVKQALLLDASTGAEMLRGGGYLGTAWKTLRTLDRARGDYLILPGAATPRACLGYVDAMLELADQVDAGLLPRPAAIVLPSGSAGTLAALSLGAAYLGWDTEVVGIRIATPLVCNRFAVRSLQRGITRFLAARVPGFDVRRTEQTRFCLRGDAIGPGYGFPTPEAVEAVPRVQELIGVQGEVTYSAKALVGLQHLAREPRFAGKPILLWNTFSSVRPPVAPDARQRLPAAFRDVLDAPELA